MDDRGLTPRDLTSHSATFLFVVLYVLVAAAATTHEDLLRGTRVTLPLLDVGVPVLGFFIFAPLFVVALHVNLLLRQYLVIRRLTPGRFSGRSTYPGSSTDPDPLQVLFLASEGQTATRWLIRDSLHFVYLALFAMLPLLVLVTIQARFVPYHHKLVTFLHQLLVYADLAAILILLSLILAPRMPWRRGWSIRPPARDPVARSQAGPPQRVQDRVACWFERRESSRLVRALRSSRLGRVAWSVLVIAVLWPLYRWLKFMGVVGALLVVVVVSSVLVPPGYLSELEPLSHWLDRHPSLGARRNLMVVGKDLSGGGSHGGDGSRQSRTSGAERGLDLSGRDLRFADLRDNDLSGAWLSGADLSKAQLNGSILGGADLSSRDGERTDLRGADLRGVDLSGADLREAILVAANLQGARGRNVDLRVADLRYSDLKKARFEGLDAREALLDRSDLSRSSIWASTFDSAMLVGADLSESSLVGASFRHADLAGARFVGSDLRLSDFMTARVAGAEFRAARLEGAVAMAPVVVDLQGIKVGATDFCHIGFYEDGKYVEKATPLTADLADLLDPVPGPGGEEWVELEGRLRERAQGTTFWQSIAARLVAAENRRFDESCLVSPALRHGPVLQRRPSGSEPAAGGEGERAERSAPVQVSNTFWAGFADRLLRNACESADQYLVQVVVERAMGCLTPRVPELERVLIDRLNHQSDRSAPATETAISAVETGRVNESPSQRVSCDQKFAEFRPLLESRLDGQFLEDFGCTFGDSSCRSVQVDLCPRLFERTRRPDPEVLRPDGILARLRWFLKMRHPPVTGP